MKATYKWIIEHIFAKKVFTDKNNNIRENVIKEVILSYVGKFTEENGKEDEYKIKVTVRLDLFKLDNFTPIEELSKNDILNIALGKLNPKEKERIEKSVMYRFGDLEQESNLISLILKDE